VARTGNLTLDPAEGRCSKRCCIAAAHLTASEAEGKANISPSPVFFTSLP
jgi:hypothetical protein